MKAKLAIIKHSLLIPVLDDSAGNLAGEPISISGARRATRILRVGQKSALDEHRRNL